MLRTVRSRRLGNQRFFRLGPCFLGCLSEVYVNLASLELVELGQQICDKVSGAGSMILLYWLCRIARVCEALEEDISYL